MAEVVEEKYELTNLSKVCIIHALHAFSKQDGSDKIKTFCSELITAVSGKVKDKRRFTIPQQMVNLEGHIDDFYNKKLSAKELVVHIGKILNECLKQDFNHESLFRLCWKIYRTEKRPDNAVREFSNAHPAEHDDCMYYLWLIFNSILSPESDEIRIRVECLNEVLKRLFDLCGHAIDWPKEELEYKSTSEMLDYPKYLKAIANYNVKFDLKSALTCEVIQDLRDEMIDAVLKKSYLTKKGHKMKTWKRRWFVLQKTTIKYWESKEKPVMKGQMVLNANTRVTDIPDRAGNKMYCFEVICGKTKKTFEIAADDEKSKHDWILAINKAIGLARLLVGEKVKEVSDRSSNPHLRNFYLIKFGLSQSIIPKLEGGVKHAHDGQNDWSEDDEDNQSPTSTPTNINRSRSSGSLENNQSSYVGLIRSSRTVVGRSPRPMRDAKEHASTESFAIHDGKDRTGKQGGTLSNTQGGTEDGVMVEHEKSVTEAATVSNQSFEDLSTDKERKRREEAENMIMGLEQSLAEEQQRVHEATVRVEEADQQAKAAFVRAKEANQRADDAVTKAEAAEARAVQTERTVEDIKRQREQAVRERDDARRRIDQLSPLVQEQEKFQQERQRFQQEKLQLEQSVSEYESSWIFNSDEVTLTDKKLGKGSWAKVKVAWFRGTRVAAKCLHQVIISNYNRQLFIREINMAARVRHPNLVQFIGASLEGNPVLLTELMTTSLRVELQKQGPIAQQQTTTISLDVAQALNYLHMMKPHPMIHRDISSSNVLLNPLPGNTWKAKVADYGTVNLLQSQQTKMPGCIAYAAPEAPNPANQSPKMDIYSFGILLIEILTGEQPNVQTRKENLSKIEQSVFSILVRKCVNEERDLRPSAQDIISDLTIHHDKK